MEQQADYIQRIEINGLWGRFNIRWDLRPDVNIPVSYTHLTLPTIA